MGSSSNGKKHKKDKKHKHHSRSPIFTNDITYDLTEDGHESSSHRHRKHKKHRDHRDRHGHRHKHYEREREFEKVQVRRDEVIAVQGSDSDSSDCVEVPLDAAPPPPKINLRKSVEKEPTAPPPPQLSKHADYEREKERERERRDREREREREHEREKERERERQREREKEHDRERERERQREYEREKEKEREKDKEWLREREREREKEKEREKERERANRDRRHHHNREEKAGKAHERGERHKDRSRSFSPIPESGAGDCLSIAETNKLRAKLGLKPLEVDAGPTKPASNTTTDGNKGATEKDKDLSSYKDEWGEFLHKPADNLKEKAAAEKLREKLKQRKEKRSVEDRLAQVRTLGESDDEVDNVSKWVERNKRVVDQKKAAELRAKALEEMDAEFGVDELVEQEKRQVRRDAYSARNLKGLRVEHDMEEFSEGKTVILTLKDKNVLEEEDGDTLVNVNMIDNERYRKNVATKKQNPLSYGYNVYEEQYDEFGEPIERGILEKYDEGLDGESAKKKNFVIGDNIEEERTQKRRLLEIKTKLAGKRLETLADTTIQLATDTYTETEMLKFKKPKKKVKKLRSKLKAEDLLPMTSEQHEQHLGSRHGRRRMSVEDDDTNEVIKGDVPTEFKLEEEEDDLHRVLTKARKLKQKENVIKKLPSIDVESIKQEIKTEPANAEDMDVHGGDGNIVLNATAEFCRTLGDIPTYGMAGNRDEDSNDMMDFETRELVDERDKRHAEEPEALNHGTWNSVNPDEVMQPADLDEIAEDVEEVAILDEEPDVGAGVANALRLALSKGYLEKEEHNRPSNSKMAHLQAKNYSIEDKSAGDDDKFGRRDRFHAGPIMEFKDKETFKPNVKLEYIDDNGRILNLKEAFRYLSHKFHGKGPGKNKIEKRLKKMEQEGLMKTMSSTDTPLGTLTMLQQKQKETKTPYVVLSGGKQSATNVSGTISKYK